MTKILWDDFDAALARARARYHLHHVHSASPHVSNYSERICRREPPPRIARGWGEPEPQPRPMPRRERPRTKSFVPADQAADAPLHAITCRATGHHLAYVRGTSLWCLKQASALAEAQGANLKDVLVKEVNR
jgi:hypothetical protein